MKIKNDFIWVSKVFSNISNWGHLKVFISLNKCEKESIWIRKNILNHNTITRRIIKRVKHHWFNGATQ